MLFRLERHHTSVRLILTTLALDTCDWPTDAEFTDSSSTVLFMQTESSNSRCSNWMIGKLLANTFMTQKGVDTKPGTRQSVIHGL